ncbi:hypothetical protein BER93_00210 [Xanthomonas fragariae]|nr:hypothetical protein BER92_00205 [Xanthomonas fragariae]AOD16848.1 hypothetical protein BER93_00210 [Xanthomonas fragariae]
MPGLNTPYNALVLRRKLLLAFERAEAESDPAACAATGVTGFYWHAAVVRLRAVAIGHVLDVPQHGRWRLAQAYVPACALRRSATAGICR